MSRPAVCVSPQVAEAIRERVSLTHPDTEQAALEQLAHIVGGWEQREALFGGEPVQLSAHQARQVGALVGWDPQVTEVLLGPVSAEGLAHHLERWTRPGCRICRSMTGEDLIEAALVMAAHRREHRRVWRRWRRRG